MLTGSDEMVDIELSHSKGSLDVNILGDVIRKFGSSGRVLEVKKTP